jgi:translocation and assembly module TamB
LPDLPAPEATPFSLPELPVSIRIEKVAIGKVALGEQLFGQAADIRVQGSGELADGAGKVALDIRRIDGTAGAFTFDGAYSNTTRNLDLSLILSEGANGIAANLIGLPDRPSVDLRIAGAGPISAFSATIAFETAGVRRLSGAVTLGSGDSTDASLGQHFAADISGDIRPLVLPQYRTFLGPDLRLALSGARPAEGGFRIDALALKADAMTLEGLIAFGPDSWPLRFDLTGRVASGDGQEVLLTLPGPETRVQDATFVAQYDAAKGNGWTLGLSVSNLRRDTIAMAKLGLSGSGQLAQGNGALIGQVSGGFDLALDGLQLRDAALAEAVGTSLNGMLRFEMAEGEPLSLPQLSLKGDDFALSGALVFKGLQEISNLAVSGNVDLVAADLSRFAALSGLTLNGAANLGIGGDITVLDGGFDLEIAGRTRDLKLGIARLDPLIAGAGKLDIAVQRNGSGTTIERLTIATPQSNISADARLTSKASTGHFDARIANAGLIDPDLSGPTGISGMFRQLGTDWKIEIAANGDGSAVATLDGTAVVKDGLIETVTGHVSLQAEDLRPYSGLVGQRIGGGLDLSADGTADLVSGAVAGAMSGTGRDLKVGQPELDLLLRGASTFATNLRRNEDGVLVFDRLDLASPHMVADVTGSVSPLKSRLRFNLDLRDIAVLYPDFSGPVAAEGVVSASGADWTVNSELLGPGGINAKVAGLVAADASRANLTIAGTGPIALANRYITPNLAAGTAAFDLSLAGPIGLNALSGTIRTNDARVSVPGLRLAFGDISATVQLGSGRAQLDAVSSVSSGGQVNIAGPISLTAPYATDLSANLIAVGVSEPGIYQTTVDGQIAIQGALGGGAAISGTLALGPVEIRVPETTGAANGALTGLIHKNEPADVRQTRVWAGLVDSGGSGGVAAAYPLDLIINAPARIFIRGRGLDAELGGALRLRGTTANVIPEGRFDLIRGRLDILGKRLNLTEAVAQLQGDFDPFLRVVSVTESGGTSISFVIEGPVSNLTVTISSSPSLPEDEILSRLLFGRALTQISALQALQIATAVNTLAGGSGVGIVSQLREKFGLDDLDVSTSETGEAGVRVGKYITENIYSDVTVNSSGKSEINLNLSITPSLTARGRLGSDGNSGIGLFFEKDY